MAPAYFDYLQIRNSGGHCVLGGPVHKPLFLTRELRRSRNKQMSKHGKNKKQKQKKDDTVEIQHTIFEGQTNIKEFSGNGITQINSQNQEVSLPSKGDNGLASLLLFFGGNRGARIRATQGSGVACLQAGPSHSGRGRRSCAVHTALCFPLNSHGAGGGAAGRGESVAEPPPLGRRLPEWEKGILW